MPGNAPPRLVYALTRPPAAAAWCLLVLVLAGAVGLLRWATVGAGEQPWPALGGALLWCLCCGAAWRCWRAWPVGRIEWTGGAWLLQEAHAVRPATVAGTPRICWDGQDFLLLCVTVSSGRSHWLWLQATSDPAYWSALRCTVYWRPQPGPRA